MEGGGRGRERKTFFFFGIRDYDILLIGNFIDGQLNIY
jgi:hypothetical protein